MRFEQVIRVQKEKCLQPWPPAKAMPDAVIACRRRSAVRLPDIGNPVGVRGRESCSQLMRGGVGATVIDNDDASPIKRLRQNRSHGLGQELRQPIYWNDNSDAHD